MFYNSGSQTFFNLEALFFVSLKSWRTPAVEFCVVNKRFAEKKVNACSNIAFSQILANFQPILENIKH